MTDIVTIYEAATGQKLTADCADDLRRTFSHMKPSQQQSQTMQGFTILMFSLYLRFREEAEEASRTMLDRVERGARPHIQALTQKAIQEVARSTHAPPDSSPFSVMAFIICSAITAVGTVILMAGLIGLGAVPLVKNTDNARAKIHFANEIETRSGQQIAWKDADNDPVLTQVKTYTSEVRRGADPFRTSTLLARCHAAGQTIYTRRGQSFCRFKIVAKP